MHQKSFVECVVSSSIIDHVFRLILCKTQKSAATHSPLSMLSGIGSNIKYLPWRKKRFEIGLHNILVKQHLAKSCFTNAINSFSNGNPRYLCQKAEHKATKYHERDAFMKLLGKFHRGIIFKKGFDQMKNSFCSSLRY